MILKDRAALQDWEAFRQQISNATSIDKSETPKAKKDRIKRLETNPEEWFRYYFPNFYYSDPALFHIAATRRVINNPEWYEVRAWSRELAKSSRSMMEDLYLMLTKQKRYKLLVSSTFDNACKLMKPYVINLEANNRIIADYGVQEKPGSWTEGDITTRTGFSIRAIGAGQAPRGTRKDERRPDIIEFDDFDTDEECQNEDIINKKWKWVTEAVIPTRSISKPTLIRWNGNFIAEDCCVVRACQFADKVDQVNIRDENGNSTWPAKNTEAMIDRILSQIPFSAQQKEYFNNPHTEGKIFKEMSWGKCPPLSELRCVVIYADPSTSNKDKPSKASKNKNSSKAVVIVGKKGVRYYIYKCFLDITKNSVFVDWLYAARDYVEEQTQSYVYIENNSLQDPFFQQVLLPLIYEKGEERGSVLPVTGDDRKKPEKFFRIEANLEPKNTQGQLILNQEEKGDPHMQRLEAQFKSVSPLSKTMDGPDAVEGGIYILDTKESEEVAKEGITVIKRSSNNRKKF